ncbi:hypothetical protein RHGRI_001003 [Rhododendron griersonianum]|uniref:Uncharacterized protein n=1 Tax=Rhododendron griersonianum TaxID=479676 RepID=A0AAV6LJ26_9ERIC|nr:hypothetical protein RHGRI_001003 [Rhododendron griersonianum]
MYGFLKQARLKGGLGTNQWFIRFCVMPYRWRLNPRQQQQKKQRLIYSKTTSSKSWKATKVSPFNSMPNPSVSS